MNTYGHVVDDEGKPLEVYHGTTKDFDKFVLGHPERKDVGWLGHGLYFTNSRDMAQANAQMKAKRVGGTPKVMSVNLSLQNPYYATLEDKARLQKANSSEASKAFTEALKSKGHDGVIWKSGDYHEYVAFDPDQVMIKKAEGGEVLPFGHPQREANLGKFMEGAHPAVLNKDGTPKLFYHATYASEPIKAFDRLWSTKVRKPSMDTVGTWFSDTPSEEGGAGMYAQGQGASIYPMHLSAKKLKTYHRFEDFLRDMHEAEGRKLEEQNPKGQGSTEGLREKLKAQGYDGLYFPKNESVDLFSQIENLKSTINQAKSAYSSEAKRRWDEGEDMSLKEMKAHQKRIDNLVKQRMDLEKKADSYGGTEFGGQNVVVVFEPTQIKSPWNQGTFDPNDPDTHKAEGGEVDSDLKTAKRLGMDTSSIPEIRKAGQLREAHKTLGQKIREGSMAAAQRAKEYHESGKLPLPVGTRFTTEHSRKNKLPPFKVLAHYVDHKDPERYGYYVEQGEEGKDGFYRGLSLVSNPNFVSKFKLKYSDPVDLKAYWDNVQVLGGITRVKAEGGEVEAEPTNIPLGRAGRRIQDRMTFARKPLGITGYHGTPHTFAPTESNPLGEFDASKVGTGEGAQAYGHGLYLAEVPGVAKEYAVNLANRDMKNQGRLNAHANAKRLVKMAGDPKYAADDLRFALDVNPDHPQKELLLQTLRMLESGEYKNPLENSGRLYHVHIPDEMVDRMLHWDKPWDQQSAYVKKAIKSSGLWKQYKDNLSDFSSPMLTRNQKMRGENIHAFVEHLSGGDTVKASEALRQVGIPGIKYLDEQSRSAGKGTHNFVIFPGEERNLKIIKREAKGGSISKAGGGPVSLDAMRLALLNRPKMAEGGDVDSPFPRGRAQRRMAVKSSVGPQPLTISKEPGGQWIGGKFGGVEQVVNRYKQMGDATPEKQAVNNWLDTTLTKYMKRDFGTEKDPVRILMEEGITHHENPEAIEAAGFFGDPSWLLQRRKQYGMPENLISKNVLAKKWESGADKMIGTSSAEELIKRHPYAVEMLSENPWIKKVDPKTKIHFFDTGLGGEINFRHLTDELHNSLLENSNLPQSLKLRPESLSRMSVPQAVQHVHKINEWRKDNRAESNLEKSINSAVHLHKDYPDSNLAWYEIKHPAMTADEQAALRDADLESIEDAPESLQSKYKALEEALQYEGDTMGHCVGGYADDVASGNSRIFSLRNKRTGEPHVTIEATAPQMRGGQSAEQYRNTPFDIAQIKGKGNAKPVSKYIPFVQDFVKSGKWGDVGEIENADLIHVGNVLTPKERDDLRKQGHEVGDYVSKEDLIRFKSPPTGSVVRKAGGGLIKETVMPTLAQMKMALSGRPKDLQSIGAQEAPDMTPKSYLPPDRRGMLPPGGVATPSGMPIGGIDMSQMPGQQLMPTNALQPQGGLPQGADQGSPVAPNAPQSNILQMTPQGQQMAAMTPSAPQQLKQPQQMQDGGVVQYPTINDGVFKAEDDQPGLFRATGMAKGGQAKPYSDKVLMSTASKMEEGIAKANPKLSSEDVSKRALRQAQQKLKWERETKPETESVYGALEKSKYSDPLAKRMRNTPEVVAKRKAAAKEFLSQPTEPWTPPPPEKQAFDRNAIKYALEGFPGIEQTAFPRDVPPRADLSHVHSVYEDPENREIIKKQIYRGLPLGGETFYASLYPLKLAALDNGMTEQQFNHFVHSIAPASARNSIMNEMAAGQFLRDMYYRGIPLTDEGGYIDPKELPKTVKAEMDNFKKTYGIGLPIMPIHVAGVHDILSNNRDMREMSKANIPTNYKIPTYGTQKGGDFGKSVVLDVHEATGQTLGSPYHPYFREQGGFSNPEYGAGEGHMMNIANEIGIPGGMAQAGRWFGGGELTGLRSPRGDALDLLEKQAAYTLHHMGQKPTPANIRKYVLNIIGTGRGILLPYFKKSEMNDYRMSGYAKGGSVKVQKESLAEFICCDLGYSPKEVAEMMDIPIAAKSKVFMSNNMDTMRLALINKKAK